MDGSPAVDTGKPAAGSRGGRAFTAAALALLPALVAGGVALAARREAAQVAATAETAAAVAAAAADVRLDLLRARLESLAADPATALSGDAAGLVRALSEEPAFGALHRVGVDGTPVATAPPVTALDQAALNLEVPIAGSAGERLVATVAPEALVAPLAERLAAPSGPAALPAGTRVRLVAAGAPPADPGAAVVAEAPIGTRGFRVRVEVPPATGRAAVRFRLGAGLLGLAAAAAAGLAFAAALLGRRRDEAREPVPAEMTDDFEEEGGEDPVPINPILHDVATALTLAGAEARRLADGEAGPLDPPQADVARQLAARIDGLIRLVRQLLEEHAGGEAVGQRLDPRPASLRDLAAVAVDGARPLATARGIELVIEPAAEGADSLVGYWDADSLGRVIANVVDNAMKYTPAGGRILVSVSRDGRAALLTVRDTGAGLAADEVQAVFEAGRRGSAAERLGAPGLGLGLATSRAIVTAHGGRIWLESPGSGQGATAVIRLPLDRRRAPRGHGRWPARVDWGGGQELTATVETLSRSGAAVRLSVAPPVGALIALRIAGLPGEDPSGAPAQGDEEVAAIGRVVRILDEGHPTESEGRSAGAPDPRAPLAAIAFAEVGPGTGARLERAVAAATPARA